MLRAPPVVPAEREQQRQAKLRGAHALALEVLEPLLSSSSGWVGRCEVCDMLLSDR